MREGSLGHGDWLIVAMEPFMCSDGVSRVFRMGRHDNGDNLDANSTAESRYYNSNPFVFRLRK